MAVGGFGNEMKVFNLKFQFSFFRPTKDFYSFPGGSFLKFNKSDSILGWKPKIFLN